MSDVTRYTPLMRICAYFVDQYNKQGLFDMDRVWLLGLRALTELNFDIAASPKTVRLPVTAQKTVLFPADYISWSKIGILDANGQISTLKINNAFTTYAANSPDRVEKIDDSQINDSVTLSGAPIFSNYYYDNACYNLFGVGGGLVQYGECRIDEKNGLVLLPPDFAFDSVLFEYISCPERDVDYQVQTCLQESIIAFIEAKLKLNSMENFYAEATKSRRRLKPVTLQYFNQVIRESEAMKLRS
jgi:hypothetical protein